MIIPRQDHHLSRQAISKNALKVLYHLQHHGFSAYLVGGAVRDILLGVVPKDFDVATDAHPEQIKRIFRNCLLIGRRFRIAHIRFPGEIIEVTTFRAATAWGGNRRLSATGMLLRDNVYGTLSEDVWRRDFSMNALYYNIKDFSIVDYCNGLEDIQNKRIRIIGDPTIRYQEDPVRLLRAVRLRAKFPDFSFDADTEKALIKQVTHLSHIDNGRLFDEIIKLFHSGYAKRTYALLKQYKLFEQLFPILNTALKKEEHVQWIETALAQTDARFWNKQKLAPAFLFATLLWPVLKQEEAGYLSESLPPMRAYIKSMKRVIATQQQAMPLTRFCISMMQDIWLVQPSFIKAPSSSKQRLLNYPRFRAAYDFLQQRIACKEVDQAIGKWWEKQVASSA